MEIWCEKGIRGMEMIGTGRSLLDIGLSAIVWGYSRSSAKAKTGLVENASVAMRSVVDRLRILAGREGGKSANRWTVVEN